MLDLLSGEDTELTELEMVRKLPCRSRQSRWRGWASR